MAQAIRLRYVLGDTTLEIPAHYEGGLEGALMPAVERMAVRFRSPSLFWRGLTDEAAVVPTDDTATSLTNSGSAPAYPIIKIKRSGGTSATLQSIANETSGKELLFDLDILDGETVIVDLVEKTVASDFRDNLLGALTGGSDLMTWALLSGEQEVSVDVNEVGGPTVTATFQWTPRYWSADGGA